MSGGEEVRHGSESGSASEAGSGSAVGSASGVEWAQHEDAVGWRARRPGPEAYHVPFYGGYVDAVPEGDIVETLERQGRQVEALLRGVPPERERERYAPDKWSLREVVGHLSDSERVFQYRAIHIARGDPAALPDMDQERWAEGSSAHGRPLQELVDELVSVRAATVSLFRGLPREAWDRVGVASDRRVSVRALAWMSAGHVEHHRQILAERYGVAG